MEINKDNQIEEETIATEDVVDEIEQELNDLEENTEQELEIEETKEEIAEEVENPEVVDFETYKSKDDEVAQLNEKYQRLQAEYSNYMRRTQKEKEEIGLFANQKFVQELIPEIAPRFYIYDTSETWPSLIIAFTSILSIFSLFISKFMKRKKRNRYR